MLVLEEQHGIIGADRGTQQAAYVERSGRHHHAQAGNVREDHFAALAVIDRAAGEIAADRDANHDGRLEMAGGAPANSGHLIAQLHHGRPDVIEKLNFGNRLQPANGHADRAADDIALRPEVN